MGTGRAGARRDGLDDEEREEAAAAPAALLSDLQRTAGNRAVAAVLARQAAGGWVVDPLRAGTTPGMPTLSPDFAERRQAEVTGWVRDHLARERAMLTERIRRGYSIAEILDLVVRAVPQARELAPATLERTVRAEFAPLEIRTHRMAFDTAAVRAEISAQARLALPGLLGDPRVGADPAGGRLTVGLSGVAAGVRRGGVEAEAELGWTGDLTLRTRVGAVLFEAKLSPPRGGGEPEWEIVLQFPGEDGLMPMLDALPNILAAGERGLRGAASDLLRGGDPAARGTAAHMGAVKSAVEAVSALAKAGPGVRAGIKASGEGGGFTLQATLTVTF